MKLNKNWIFLLSLWASSAAAFSPQSSSRTLTTTTSTRYTPASPTRHYMFGGAGEGMPSEDNPEDLKKMEDAAKAMGMSLEEYKLGIGARVRLMAELDAARVKGGTTDKVAVERDGNNPPKFLEITITDDGKALGKEQLSKELVKALKVAAEGSQKARVEAQKGMMTFVSEEMKKLK